MAATLDAKLRFDSKQFSDGLKKAVGDTTSFASRVKLKMDEVKQAQKFAFETPTTGLRQYYQDLQKDVGGLTAHFTRLRDAKAMAEAPSPAAAASAAAPKATPSTAAAGYNAAAAAANLYAANAQKAAKASRLGQIALIGLNGAQDYAAAGFRGIANNLIQLLGYFSRFVPHLAAVTAGVYALRKGMVDEMVANYQAAESMKKVAAGMDEQIVRLTRIREERKKAAKAAEEEAAAAKKAEVSRLRAATNADAAMQRMERQPGQSDADRLSQLQRYKDSGIIHIKAEERNLQREIDAGDKDGVERRKRNLQWMRDRLEEMRQLQKAMGKEKDDSLKRHADKEEEIRQKTIEFDERRKRYDEQRRKDGLEMLKNAQDEAKARLAAQASAVASAVANERKTPQDRKNERKETRAEERATRRAVNREANRRTKVLEKEWNDNKINNIKRGNFFDRNSKRREMKETVAAEWKSMMKAANSSLTNIENGINKLVANLGVAR